MEKKAAKRIFIIALAVAVALIAIGAYNVWKSFQKFDNSILEEKDTQFYSLIRSGDINIENSIDSFAREAETYLSREKLKNEIRDWRSSGRTAGLVSFIEENPLQMNPIYSDLVMLNKEKVYRSATGNTAYSFLTDPDTNGIRLCRGEDGVFHLAYEYEYSKNIKFDALIDLAQLYSTAVGTNPEREIMLMDYTTSIMLTEGNGKIEVRSVLENVDEKTLQCREYMIECQKENYQGGMSLELEDSNGQEYTARMVVTPAGRTVNGEFAMAVLANYEEAIAPSRAAAEGILVYGGMAIIGIIGLLFLLILMRRINDASSAELRALKKKNEVMEEINQKMQALTHHQRLETIGTMTASIAHDFNNLLTPIMGYSIMTMEMLPADATDLQENLMEVYNASVKAKDIVTRLAELTKKSNEENYKEVEVDEAIKSALKVTLPAKPKNVEVKASFGAKDLLIKADRTQISQLVMNIVLNAYDALRETGGTVKVSTRKSGEEVVIRFRDNGCGMDAETVARIFDPFYTTKESGKGTGLGLAIVAQIVETYGGRIYVESQPGEGTEFRIYLPCCGGAVDSFAWGPNGEGKFDTRRYTVNLIRREIAKAEAEKKRLEQIEKKKDPNSKNK